MSITLRRKMFKLGGEVNTHGIGITSGLEYRRDGYNAGGPVVKPGPDGKLRQHAVAGGILSAILRGTAGTAMPFVRSIARRLPGRLGGPREMGAGPGIRDYVKYGIDPKRTLGAGPIKELSGAQQARQLANLAFAPSGAALGAAGLGQALGERAGVINPVEEDDRLITQLLKGTGEFALNVNPLNVASRGSQMLFGDPKAEDKNLYDLIAGREDEDKKIGSSLVDDSIPKDTQRTQEEEFSRMVEDSKRREDLYYAALSDGPNKVEALKRAALYAGQNIDEGLGEGFKGIAQGVSEVLDEDAAIRNEAKRAAVSDVIGGESQRQQMFDQAKLAIMSSPELTPEQRSKAIQGLQAYEDGVVDILPTNEKGDAADDSRMATGTVYYDPANLYGGMYVAKPTTEGAESKAFTTLEEAQAHAAS